MQDLKTLLTRNRAFAAGIDLTKLAMPAAMPDKLLLVLTCVDPRVEPAGFLGINTGDAGVLRNAGGRVDDRVIEDIAYLAMRLGVRMDVAVIHHTQCGTGLLAEPTFRQAFADRTGLGPADLAAKAVTEPTRTVTHDVAKLLASPCRQTTSSAPCPVTCCVSKPGWSKPSPNPPRRTRPRRPNPTDLRPSAGEKTMTQPTLLPSYDHRTGTSTTLVFRWNR